MPESDHKQKIKELLAKIGKDLGGGAGVDRLVVLRCSTLEDLQTAMRLLPRVYPRIKWLPAPVGKASITDTIAKAVQVAGTGKTVPILYDFPGEMDERMMTREAAIELEEVAANTGMAKSPVLIVISPATVRQLVSNAPKFWAAKTGYYAWPGEPPPSYLEQTEEIPSESTGSGEMKAPSIPQLTMEGFQMDAPEVEETRKVLEKLSGEEAAEYLVGVARSHLAGGDAENARMFLLRAVQIYSQTADLGGMATAYHLLGVGAQNRGDQETALEWFEQAIDNLRILDDNAGLSEVIGTKGYAYYQIGQSEAAVKAFNEALKIDEELGLHERVSAGYRKVAMVMERSTKFSAAEELYLKSLEVEEAHGSSAGIARVQHHLGRLKENLEQYDEARSFYEKSLELKAQDEDKSGLATTYHQLGNLSIKMGEYPDAIENYKKAVELETKLGDRHGLARTLAQLGLCYRDQGMVEEALHALIRGYQILQRLRSPVATEVLMKVEELQDLITADAFNRILREASADTTI